MIRYTTTHEPGLPVKTEAWVGIVVKAEVLPDASPKADVALQLTTLSGEYVTISFNPDALQSLYGALVERYVVQVALERQAREAING